VLNIRSINHETPQARIHPELPESPILQSSETSHISLIREESENFGDLGDFARSDNAMMFYSWRF
jgi:hypothetical protein